MKRNKAFTVDNFRICVFMVLAVTANLCACYYFNVGVKYAVGLIVLCWTLVEFAVKPDFEKAKHILKYALLFMAPFALFWVWSAGIWIVRLQTIDYMIRGSKNIFYMFTAISYFCGAYYLFGKKSVFLNFYAMCIANGFDFLVNCRIFGVGTMLREYVELVFTFANKTGSAIIEMELHDMVFGFGAYCIFFAVYREGGKLRLGHLLLSVFFFTLGFKRIGIAAAIVAGIVAFILLNLREKTNKRIFAISFWVAAIGIFLYLVSIRNGWFFEFAAKAGINLMGRQWMYKAYDSFYTLSPFYAGQGIRFVYNFAEKNGGVINLHNVFLELYIEVGFIAWALWLWIDMRLRIKLIAERYGTGAAVMLFAMTLYMSITFMTDNTFFYFPPNVAYRHISMFWADEYDNMQKSLPDACKQRGVKKILHYFDGVRF